MLCIIDVDTSDQERAARKVVALTHICVDDAARDIQKHGLPSLYKAGVKYVRQDKRACAFKLPSQVMAAGGGDCKQLVLWRLGELLLAGEHATARVIWIPEAQGFRAHEQVRRKDGRIECPSYNLGMR